MSAATRARFVLWDTALWVLAIFAAAGAAPAQTSKPAAATTTRVTQPGDPDLVARWSAGSADERAALDTSAGARLARPAAGAKVVVEESAGRKGFRLTPNGGGLSVEDDAALNFTSDFTAALRVKLASDQGAVYLVSKRGEKGDDGWAIVHGIGGIGGVGFVAAPRVVVPTPVKAIDEWVHVAVTFHDRSFLLYVDGKAIGIMELPSVPLASKAPLVLGAGAGGKKGMDGWLDDVRIYHRALSAEDVEALAAGREPDNPYVPLAPAQTKVVRALVKQLGADEFARREEAAAKLKAMGRKVFPLLKEYREAEDVEVSSRIKAILGELPSGDGGPQE
jgi:hypothetical protein